MPKVIKPNARKAPTPSGNPAEVDDWLPRVMPGLQPIVSHLDRQIRRTHQGLQYAIKWKRAFYGLPDRGWILELVPYDVSVNLVFHGGADFDDPPPLGDAGRSRYVKLRSLEAAKAPEVARWIEQAGRVDGWR